MTHFLLLSPNSCLELPIIIPIDIGRPPKGMLKPKTRCDFYKWPVYKRELL